MPRTIKLKNAGLLLVIEISDDGDVRLLKFAPTASGKIELSRSNQHSRWNRLVEVQATGENQNDHHGSKYTGTSPGMRLKFRVMRKMRTPLGLKVEIEQFADDLQVTSHIQFVRGSAMARCWTTLENTGNHSIQIEYVSSFALNGLAAESPDRWAAGTRLHVPHNTWHGESQWRDYPLPELGLSQVVSSSTKRLSYEVRGTLGSDGFLPTGVLVTREGSDSTPVAHFWQIEHHGSWHWEIGDLKNQLYLRLSGPTFNEGHWCKALGAGESFDSVQVAVGAVCGGFTRAIEELTKYRRKIRRPNEDNRRLPVIFNDYMNCLSGEPTTAKLLPLIDAAADAGCECFCIDCGWYDDGPWWQGVGEWLPSKARFPGGIHKPLNHIRKRGMIPGLWLEIEVMGINCPLAKRVPDDWFFQRAGRRLIDHGRYQLDFRNPQVVRHVDEVIDRVVGDYGVGYIKMDYNINAGVGTDLNADSVGDGLLEHQRAYLDWLDRVWKRYPSLTIENCASGGLRMAYSLLSRHSIQSTSDQTDYRKYAVIAAASPAGVTPEQAAVWSYPLRGGHEEETIFNMVNALLLRVHQSGHLAELSPTRAALVKEGIAYYKRIRKEIPSSVPFWPLGMPRFDDGWVCLGARCKSKDYLAVWRLNGNKTARLSIEHRRENAMTARVGYPSKKYPAAVHWAARSGELSITLPKPYTARLIELSPSRGS